MPDGRTRATADRELGPDLTRRPGVAVSVPQEVFRFTRRLITALSGQNGAFR
jgi:hypothetical protein